LASSFAFPTENVGWSVGGMKLGERKNAEREGKNEERKF
jgi:hypothetical protein